ncbi:MFS transporter [Caballeronia grimmiae]|uniref:Transporter n=1 Tax=Caballeronia grimmiae TaxID=1071679 RepID=A0A069NES2_9BURK|nr:MFS transporter [Caballeronia grimmiae]KDR26149.1 transporter [Caballeronia grimmiae]GGD97843.1 MFS transporter [Caballeronia grimmiae]
MVSACRNETWQPAWLAVASLALGTFASVTTEFLPIGLLTNIAGTLRVSEGAAGLMVTMPGIFAAAMGPVLILASGRLDRRVVLLALSALLVLSNTLAALAPSLIVMLVARALLGLCVGGFWTFAPGATGLLVPAKALPRAMSYVLAGISVATIAGVPAGVLIGNMAGWRVAFTVTAILAAGVLALQFFALPSLPSARAITPRDLLAPFYNRSARRGLVMAVLLVAGHFAGYTYLRPMLQHVYNLSAGAVTSLLLIYGVAGFVGTFVGGRLVSHSVRGTAVLAAVVIGAVLVASALGARGVTEGAAATLAWGAAFGLVPVSMTSWMLNALPNAPEAGQAVLVTVFQIAISLGATLGGFVVDSVGVVGALLLGGALAAASAIPALSAAAGDAPTKSSDKGRTQVIS